MTMWWSARNAKRSVLGLVLPLLFLTLAADEALADRRVALIIGNGDYAQAPDLPNPPNDAREVTGALERLGFEVEVTLDADIDAMRAALRGFVQRLPGADVALFYYAGHGLQYAGENYLIPTNAALEQEADLHFEALGLNLVMDLLEDPDRTTLVFLDACRDNPLARSLARSLGATRSARVGRGLARVEGGIGTLIAFATAPGDVALDGAGNNSPFTEALLEHIDQPELEVRQMLSRVRDRVYRETGGEQLPWDNSSLRSDFYFNPEPAPASPPEQTVAARPPDGSSSDDAARAQSPELAFWQAIENSRSPQEYELFLEQFPDSVFAGLARTRLAALREEPEAEPEAPASLPEAVPEPEPEEEPEVAIEVIDAERLTVTDANFRGRPTVDGERLGTLPAGTRVAVRGRVEGADWYQIERPGGGGVAYVYAPLLEDPASAAAAQEPEDAQSPEADVAAPASPDPTTEGSEAPDARDEAAEAAPASEGPRGPETETAALVAPSETPAEVDAPALAAELLDQWSPGRFRYEDPVRGRCSESVKVAGWNELEPAEADLALAGQEASRTVSARRHGSFQADAELVAVVEPELVSLTEYKRLKANSRRGWCLEPHLESSLFAGLIRRAPYLTDARIRTMERHSTGGFEFVYALLERTADDGTQGCLAFMGARRWYRLDGFACAPPGGSLSQGDATAYLERIRIDGVLG